VRSHGVTSHSPAQREPYVFTPLNFLQLGVHIFRLLIKLFRCGFYQYSLFRSKNIIKVFWKFYPGSNCSIESISAKTRQTIDLLWQIFISVTECVNVLSKVTYHKCDRFQFHFAQRTLAIQQSSIPINNNNNYYKSSSIIINYQSLLSATIIGHQLSSFSVYHQHWCQSIVIFISI
jgi:hypothetical protein